MRLVSASVLFMSIALAGCQTVVPDHIVLPDAAHAEMTSTDVVASIPQKQIYVFVPNSNLTAASGGGLLWALVDAGVDAVRTSKAEKAVKPLQDVTGDYDFDKIVSTKIGEALAAKDFLHAKPVKVVKDQAALEAAVSKSDAAAVLATTVDYQLDNDGKVLTVRLYANLFPASDAMKAFRKMKPEKAVLAAQNTIYRGNFSFSKAMPEPAPKAERDAYIAAWSADKGAPLRAALDEAAANIAAQLARDL